MPEKIQKTLVLKRCYVSEGNNLSLEEILKQIELSIPSSADRVFGIDLFKSDRIAYIKQDEKLYEGVFVGIFRQNSDAVGVVDTTLSKEANIEKFNVPNDKEWLDSEITLYVTGNNVVACNLASKGKSVENLISSLAEKEEIVPEGFNFQITDVPNTPEIRRVSKIGVRHIDLNITSYLSTFETFPSVGLEGKMGKILEQAFGTPSDMDRIKKRASTKGRLCLTRGAFAKEEVRKDEWVTRIGETIIDEDMDDYTLTLEDGTKISTKTLRVSKSVKLNKHANSFCNDDASKKMLDYYDELKGNGSLNW